MQRPFVLEGGALKIKATSLPQYGPFKYELINLSNADVTIKMIKWNGSFLINGEKIRKNQTFVIGKERTASLCIDFRVGCRETYFLDVAGIIEEEPEHQLWIEFGLKKGSRMCKGTFFFELPWEKLPDNDGGQREVVSVRVKKLGLKYATGWTPRFTHDRPIMGGDMLSDRKIQLDDFVIGHYLKLSNIWFDKGFIRPPQGYLLDFKLFNISKENLFATFPQRQPMECGIKIIDRDNRNLDTTKNWMKIWPRSSRKMFIVLRDKRCVDKINSKDYRSSGHFPFCQLNCKTAHGEHLPALFIRFDLSREAGIFASCSPRLTHEAPVDHPLFVMIQP